MKRIFQTSTAVLLAISSAAASAQTGTLSFSLADFQPQNQDYRLTLDPALLAQSPLVIRLSAEVGGQGTLQSSLVNSCSYVQANSCTGISRAVQHSQFNFEVAVQLSCDDRELLAATYHDSEFSNEVLTVTASVLKMEEAVVVQNLNQCQQAVLVFRRLDGQALDHLSGNLSVGTSSSTAGLVIKEVR